MAHRVGGGGGPPRYSCPPDHLPPPHTLSPSFDISGHSHAHDVDFVGESRWDPEYEGHRQRDVAREQQAGYHHGGGRRGNSGWSSPGAAPVPVSPSPVRSSELPMFFVLKESIPPSPSPPPPVPTPLSLPPSLPPSPPLLEPAVYLRVERTSSGLPISQGSSPDECDDDDCGITLMDDAEAARWVREATASFRGRFPDSTHERILKSLIHPKSVDAEYELDNDALCAIFSAANEIFFNRKLSGRVTWDWSHSSSTQYEGQIIGTTAMRKSSRLRGFETLIVLSSPILKDTRYNRRLLISTFLHELIHSYLFISCGFKARSCGGHTPGFMDIANFLDDWAGHGALHLCDMEADLRRFQQPEKTPTPPFHEQHHQPQHHSHSHFHHHGHRFRDPYPHPHPHSHSYSQSHSPSPSPSNPHPRTHSLPRLAPHQLHQFEHEHDYDYDYEHHNHREHQHEHEHEHKYQHQNQHLRQPYYDCGFSGRYGSPDSYSGWKNRVDDGWEYPLEHVPRPQLLHHQHQHRHQQPGTPQYTFASGPVSESYQDY